MVNVCKNGLNIKINENKVGKSIEEKWYRLTPEYRAEKTKQREKREALYKHKMLLQKNEKMKIIHMNQIIKIRKSIEKLCRCAI